MSGRACSILALICVPGAGLVTARGGSSARAGPSPVSLLLTAPNDGAIVSVRTIEVIGQVTTKGGYKRTSINVAVLFRPAASQAAVNDLPRGARRPRRHFQ